MEIHKAIHIYLELVERRLGRDVRRETVLEYRGGRNLFLKSPYMEQGRLIDIGTLMQMIRNFSRPT